MEFLKFLALEVRSEVYQQNGGGFRSSFRNVGLWPDRPLMEGMIGESN